MTIRLVLISVAVFSTVGAARAEVCPDEVPSDSVQRRAQAKKWFGKGDEAVNAGDDLAALKAFQCSLKFVPHGFTAFNIAQIAERIGDLELAISSYNQYLLLVPDAKDTQEVNHKLDALRERLAQVRQKEKDSTALSPATVAEAPASAVVESPRGDEGTEPPPQAPDATASDAGSKPTESVTSQQPAASPSRAGAWIAFGSSGILAGAAVLFNLAARGKMDTCRTKYQNSDRPAAESACNDAKPLAYTSYGFIGASAAALVVGTVLILRPTPSSSVGVNVLPEGGLAFRLGGQF
jgi:tetratricopeptide (TPR) repeat protein